MKKVLVATILGLATVASTFAQGKINLESYLSALNPIVTQGSLMPTPGTPVDGYQVGFYFAVGNVATGSDGSANNAIISSFAPLLSLATGTGSAATTGAGGYLISSGNDYTFAGLASGPATIIVVAWTGGATYDTASIRGHSAAFQITPTQFGPGALVGNSMGSFVVNPVPEPSTFALAGLGLAGLLIFRRRN